MGMTLTKEFVNSCRKVGVLRDFLCQAIDQVDEKNNEIAELKAENERLKKCEIWMKQHFYCEEVIACESAKNRRLKRALWLARAERAHSIILLWNVYCYQSNSLYYRDFLNIKCNPFRNLTKKTAMEWSNLWKSIETKLRAKAKEYK